MYPVSFLLSLPSLPYTSYGGLIGFPTITPLFCLLIVNDQFDHVNFTVNQTRTTCCFSLSETFDNKEN